MWSPGGKDFSSRHFNNTTLIFFVNCGILKSLFECLGPKYVFIQSVLERCHAEHTTFLMSRRKVITFVASHLSYMLFVCLAVAIIHF